MQKLLFYLFFGSTFVSAQVSAATWRVQVASDSEVYAQPAFSSKIVENLKQGTVVYMSTEKFIGQGGMGVFFKIKTATGKVGYVADSDLLAPSSKGLKPIPVPGPPPAAPPVAAAAAAAETYRGPRKGEGPASLLGLSIAFVDYSEKVLATKYNRSHIFFGARHTTAGRGKGRIRLDSSLLVSPGAPKFLASAGAYGDTSGFIVLADCSLLWPFLEQRTYMFFGSAGPALAYSKYSTNLANDSYSYSKMRFGGNLDVGYAYMFSGGAFRIDLRYYLEKTSYLSEMVSLQMSY